MYNNGKQLQALDTSNVPDPKLASINITFVWVLCFHHDMLTVLESIITTVNPGCRTFRTFYNLRSSTGNQHFDTEKIRYCVDVGILDAYKITLTSHQKH